MRLYGSRRPSSSSNDKPKHTSNHNQVVFHLNHDFEDHESKNMGKFDCIYPTDDKKMQDLYNVFLSGAESIFKHSFDMKVKETIARVRKDRKQEQIAKEEEEKKKVEKRKRAQRIARAAALAAIAIKDASKNATLLCEGISTLDQIEGTTKAVIDSAQSLKEDCNFERWSSMEWSKSKLASEHQKLNKNLVCNHDVNLNIANTSDKFIHNEEMTVQEKIDQWQQKGCFEIPLDDFIHDEFIQNKDFAEKPLLDARINEKNHQSEKVSNQDGGVVLMLEQNELDKIRLLKQEEATQQLEQDTQALLQKIIQTENGYVQEDKIQSNFLSKKSMLQHTEGRLWKKVDQSNIGIRGHQLTSHFQKKQQGNYISLHCKFNMI